MMIEANDRIAGIPALRVRQLFIDGQEDDIWVDDAQELFLMGEPLALAKLIDLEQEGFLVRCGTPADGLAWQLTEKGRAVAQADAPLPLSNLYAVSVFAKLMGVAQSINQSPRFPHWVKSIAVQGDWLLAGGGDIPFLEVAVEIVPKLEANAMHRASQANIANDMVTKKRPADDIDGFLQFSADDIGQMLLEGQPSLCVHML